MKKAMMLLVVGISTLAACNDPKGRVGNDQMEDATADTAVVYKDEIGPLAADGAEVIDVGEDFWSSVNWDAPVMEDPEMQAAGVEVRASEEYTIYTIDDRVLFDTDKAQIRPEGEQKLQEMVKEFENLPPNGQIRVFGHADARAGDAYNMELSAERANAVKNWLQSKGGINASRLSIEAMGEEVPRATNETARGRQLNRRVAVVVVTRQ